MKIRTLILLTFSALSLAGSLFLYRWTTDSIRPNYLKVVEENLVDTSRTFAALLSARGVPDRDRLAEVDGISAYRQNDSFRAVIYDFEKTESDLEFYITDSRGTVLFHSGERNETGSDYSRWNDVHLTLQGHYGARSTRTDPDDPATSRLHVAAPLLSDGAITGVLTVIKPITSPYRFMEEGRRHDRPHHGEGNHAAPRGRADPPQPARRRCRRPALLPGVSDFLPHGVPPRQPLQRH